MSNFDLMDIDGQMRRSRPSVYAVQDKFAPIQNNPHYTDHRFDTPQVVYGRQVDGLAWDYDDRLSQWDYEKDKAARKLAFETFQKCASEWQRNADFYERYLTAYFGRPIELVCIMAGVNRGNGYPYLVFGYRDAQV